MEYLLIPIFFSSNLGHFFLNILAKSVYSAKIIIFLANSNAIQAFQLKYIIIFNSILRKPTSIEIFNIFI